MNTSSLLYPNAKVSVQRAVDLIIKWTVDSNTSWRNLDKLLIILGNYLLPEGNKLPLSSKTLRYTFDPNPIEQEDHYYCDRCYSYLGSNNDFVKAPENLISSQLQNSSSSVFQSMKNNNTSLLRCHCGNEIEVVPKIGSSFKVIPFEKQINDIISKPSLKDHILNSINQRYIYINEIMTGIKNSNDDNFIPNPSSSNTKAARCLVKQRAIKEKISLEEANRFLSISINTDGIKLYESNINSCWPVIVSLKDLSPFSIGSYFILTSIWIGRSSEKPIAILEPLCREILAINNRGGKFNNKAVS
jgi:hypothetical protein